MTFLWALLAGAGAVIVYLGLCLAVAGPHPLKLVEGADGRLSTSKAQWFLWTGAVAFGYVAVYTARATMGDHSALSTVPHNVMIALGFSTTTTVAAKGITWAYVSNPNVNVTKQTAASSSATDLVSDDSGVPDLSKAQLLIFTFIAIGIFIVNIVDQINNISLNGPTSDNSALPDIDTVLMILMGLSQGGYLGKKLVTIGTPSTLLPSSVSVAGGAVAVVSLYGSGFGDPPAGTPRNAQGFVVPAGCGVTLDGYAADMAADWTDTNLQVSVNPAKPPISTWPATQTQGQVQVAVTSFGQPASTPLTLTVSR